jgi:hypothetical protein
LRNVYSDHLPISIWIICDFVTVEFLSSLFILDINPLLDKELAKFFSYSVSCLSTLLKIPLLAEAF